MSCVLLLVNPWSANQLLDEVTRHLCRALTRADDIKIALQHRHVESVCLKSEACPKGRKGT